MAVYDSFLGRLLHHKHKVKQHCFIGYCPMYMNMTATRYYGLSGWYAQQFESHAQGAIWKGTFKELKVYVGMNSRDGITIIQFRVNKLPSMLALTIPAGKTGLFTVTFDVPVETDDLVCFYVDAQGTTGYFRFSTSLKFEVG